MSDREGVRKVGECCKGAGVWDTVGGVGDADVVVVETGGAAFGICNVAVVAVPRLKRRNRGELEEEEEREMVVESNSGFGRFRDLLEDEMRVMC